jgi:hypothetical protein
MAIPGKIIQWPDIPERIPGGGGPGARLPDALISNPDDPNSVEEGGIYRLPQHLIALVSDWRLSEKETRELVLLNTPTQPDPADSYQGPPDPEGFRDIDPNFAGAAEDTGPARTPDVFWNCSCCLSARGKLFYTPPVAQDTSFIQPRFVRYVGSLFVRCGRFGKHIRMELNQYNSDQAAELWPDFVEKNWVLRLGGLTGTSRGDTGPRRYLMDTEYYGWGPNQLFLETGWINPSGKESSADSLTVTTRYFAVCRGTIKLAFCAPPNTYSHDDYDPFPPPYSAG